MSASSFTIDLTEASKAALQRIDGLAPKILQAAASTVNNQNQITIGRIQSARLSQRGPKTLGVVTNRLRASIRATDAQVNGLQITPSSIGSNVAYAGLHEFGFVGTEQIKAHTRRVKSRDVFLQGASIKRLGRTQQSRKKIATGISFVSAHVRHVNIPERAYIRETLRERAPEYASAIDTAIQAVLP